MDSAAPRPRKSNPWLWVPSLYFAEGIPYVVVMTVAVVMYKRLGVSNTEIALYTSWLYLPWVIKPFWSPLVEVLRTNRFWIVSMQLLIGAGLAGVALFIPGPDFFNYTLAFLWLLAFSSATHDIAADGFYILGLSSHDQAWFVGVRSTFYRLAMIAGQGLLIMLAGLLESYTGLPDVDVTVTAQPADQASRELDRFDPAAQQFPSEAHGLVASPAEITLTVADQLPADVDTLRQQVLAWNTRHGFCPQEEIEPVASPDEEKPQPSWKVQLEDFLRSKFGDVQARDAAPSERVGNAVVVYIKLVGEPPTDGQSMVVNLGRIKGSKSIQLVAGDRFSVTADNYAQPMAALVQLDPRLKEDATAVFRASSGNIPLAWTLTFYVLAAAMLMLGVYHQVVLPVSAADVARPISGLWPVVLEMKQSFQSFFQKPHIVVTIGFILLYRFAEAQLGKLAQPFLLDAREVGGLAISTAWVGFIYGTVGVLMLTVGGLIGGFLAARNGLKFWLWWMVLAINLPNLSYLYLAYTQPEQLWIVMAAVGVEQFGYGFGFTAFMLYMIYASQGDGNETVHYALCTGLMALGMMVPGMFCGWLQELIGYRHFFVWVMLATIPGFILAACIPLDSEFGKGDPQETDA